MTYTTCEDVHIAACRACYLLVKGTTLPALGLHGITALADVHDAVA